MQVSFKAENFVVIHAEFRHIGIGNTAGRQHFLHILLADHEGFSHLGFLVHLDALSDLLMDSLNHIQITFVTQAGGEQSFKGLLLLGGGLGDGCIENRFHQSILRFLDVLGVVERIINIGRAVIKCREQEAQRRRGHHLCHSAVMEYLLLRHIMQIRLGLLHGADGAQQICIGFFRLILLEGIILTLEGNVIAVAGQQNQIVAFDIHVLNDLFA